MIDTKPTRRQLEFFRCFFLTGLVLAWLAGPAQAQTVTVTVPTGMSPRSVAVNPVTNKVYVANSSSANVTVIDGATNTTTTVPIGANTASVAVNPVTNKIYVTNFISNNVTVIDGVTDLPITTVPAGLSPRSVAVNPVTNKIYVTNFGSANVTVIDGATNATTTVAAGSFPAAVAVNPVTNKIYVANSSSNNVTVIDGATNTTITVAAGSNPFNVGVNPVTNKIYVANFSSANVTVIDGATNTTITLAVGSNPSNVGVNPVTNKIYVANTGSANVTVIDGATNEIATVAAGSNPGSVGVNPVTNKVYVANTFSDNVTVIDGATNATTTVAAGVSPGRVAVNPITNQIYVANQGSDNVTVIDGATNTTTTVAAGASPRAAAVNPVTNQIYVANFGSNNVTVIDGITNTTTSVAAGTNPFSVAVNPVTNKIYVSNFGSNDVTVIDGITNTTTSVAAGMGASFLAVNPVTNQIYVANQSSDTVTVIDGATNTTTTIATGTNPFFVAINPVTNKIYVCNLQSGSLTVIDGATNTTTTVAAGTLPTRVAVNPVTNKIYVSNRGGTSVMVIDGTTNATTTAAAGTDPFTVAVNPVTNKIYVSNQGSNDVTVLTEQQVQTIPLTTTISPLPNDQTSSPTPSFTFTSSSTFAPTAPAVTAVYFQVDTWQGLWAAATPTGPGSFSGVAPTLSPGVHILYAYATDSQDASSIQTGGNGIGQSSPLIGQMAAYLFLVTTVSSAPLPSLSIDDVSVNKPASGTTDATFTVTLSAASTDTIYVDFATADDTALSGTDYQATSGTLTFASGETSKPIVVPILGGTPNASDKTFFVLLSSPVNATITDDLGVGTITNATGADISISASGSPDPIDTGQVLRYVVNVTNNGPLTANAVTVTHVIPSAAVFDSVSTRSGGVGCTVPAVGSSGTVTCDFGTLAVGETKGVSIMVKPQTAGTLSVLFSVVASGPDPDNTNNSAAVTTTVNLAPAVINVTEAIVVSDSVGVLPSAMIGIAENIVVTDSPAVLPSAMIGVAENIVVTDAPGVLPSAMIGVAENIVVSDTPGVTANFNTPQGTNIVVMPVDPVTNASPVTLTFTSVTQAGTTTLTSSSSGPAAPAGFAVGNPAVYYDLSTTAQFSGSVTVCISYAGVAFFRRPLLFHYENGAWIDVTVSVDIINQIVCGSVTSLSPFALFQPAGFSINLLYDPSKAKKGGSTFPIKIQIADANGNNLSSPDIAVTAVRIMRVADDSSAPLEDSGDANPDFDFRYDATLGGTGGYIFNLSTKGFANGTYRLYFTAAGDAAEHSVPFQIK